LFRALTPAMIGTPLGRPVNANCVSMTGPAPTLETLVRKADLVLRCRAETVRGKTRWRVIEAIKGEYRPKMFDQEIPGFISWTGTTTLANSSRHARPAKKHNEEVVFIRLQRLHSAEDNKWHDLYYADESFPIVADKITYPKTILWTHTPGSVEREFTLAEFSTAIRAVP
jgi:hypothetical protein